MRKIIAFNRVSADGYFASPDGGLDWTVPEDELDKAAASGLGTADTLLFGHRTYQMFESFWPQVAAEDAETAPDPHTPGRYSPELRAMANWIDGVNKIVWSRTRTEVPWRNSRLLHHLDPVDVQTTKDAPGRDMMIFGSGSIVSQLTEHGLIDEYIFVVGPVLLGTGRPLVHDVPKTVKLELAEAKAFPQGNVRLRYLRA